MSVSAISPDARVAKWWPGVGRNSALTNASIVIVLAWLVISVIGPLISPYDPLKLSPATLVGPSASHLFGTDVVGRDLLSRVIWGARVSLPYSLLVVAISLAVGTVVGGIAGYFGGWVDEVTMRLVDLVFAFPPIILAMAVAATLGPGLNNAVIAIVLVTWPTYARIVRGLVLNAMHSDYILAARLLGTSSFKAMGVDILPNIVGPLLVFATLGLGNAMLFLAGLSFLGLGAQPPTAEWGSMVSEATTYYDRWWLALFPGLAIVSVVLAFNILGNTLRDVWDPRNTPK